MTTSLAERIRHHLRRPVTYAFAVLLMAIFAGCGVEEPIPTVDASHSPVADDLPVSPDPILSEEPSPTPSVDQYRARACQAIKDLPLGRILTVEGANSVAQLGTMATDPTVNNASAALLAAAEEIDAGTLEDDWHAIYHTLLDACQVEAPHPIPRIVIECSDEDLTGKVYSTLHQAWSDKTFSKLYCSGVFLGPRPFSPTPTEKLAAKKWDGASEDPPEYKTEGAMEFCARYEPSGGRPDDLGLASAVILCPTQPHIKEMRAWAEGTKFDDGEYTVGVDVHPGRYRSEAPASDCYWERTTASGDTIDNDFVKYAPGGVTVRISRSDGGFVSERCGVWTKVD